MNITSQDVAFGQFLLERSVLPENLLQQARDVSASTRDSLPHSLVKLGFVPQQRLADELSTFRHLPRVAGPLRVPDELYDLSPDFLRHHHAIPIGIAGDQVSIAIADPLDEFVVRSIHFATRRRASASVATFADIESAWANALPASTPTANGEDIAGNSLDALKDIASDAPAIRLVQRIITAAVDRRASDIHIEPVESSVKVRFRLDGVLQDIESLPHANASAVVSRIKVMANLNIAERRLPQDGRLRITVNGKGIDFRVATAPTLHGESTVLRILDRQEVELDFSRLGFDARHHVMMQSALKKPYGIILSTGPTGSGKTTTLYTALKTLNQPDRKILTVEDPIEYMLDGVNQTQVKPTIGYSFAMALRAFLRQDPDILMVGEIRDRETAEVAIQAALTGHLLLSTLHTNTASAAVTRLLDMGIDDYLLTSTLNLIIGQRLVRRLCSECRERYVPPTEVIERLALRPADDLGESSLYRAVGCRRCGGVGYAGRTGLLELLELSEPVQRTILSHADAGAIEKTAVDLGMRTMFRHGVELALRGETTIEEVLRVTRSSD